MARSFAGAATVLVRASLSESRVFRQSNGPNTNRFVIEPLQWVFTAEARARPPQTCDPPHRQCPDLRLKSAIAGATTGAAPAIALT
jgi:hypothetical protein